MALGMIATSHPTRMASFEKAFLDRVRPTDWENPQPRALYDLAIVGAGPAGIEAAEHATRLGFSVALIERNRLGGNSLNAGSVPSKTMIRTAKLYARMHDANEFGAPPPVNPAVDFDRIKTRLRAVRARIAEYHSARRFAMQGVDLFFGTARFESADTIRADDTPIRFRRALIATGARPCPSNIPGLEQVGYHTSNTVFDLPVLPARMAVIGGGPLGCELAQAFSQLGPHVIIIQNDPKFLPLEERDAAEILSRSMAWDGVEIRLNTTVVGARLENGKRILEIENNDVRSDLQADEFVLSIGRMPNLDGLELEHAGIDYDVRRGVAVDDFLCTTNPNVYAAGDVCLARKFTNAAQASARIAVENGLLGEAKRHDDLIIPWCTYTDPEIAHVGLHVWEAHQRGIAIESYTVLMQDVDRAIADGQDTGYVKIHVEQGRDRILGATVMASHASELINEMAVIMSAGIGMTALADMVHTYPTQSEAIMRAARAFVNKVPGKHD
jgi:pyruvate/2-oxoglutarate dehydrogenase complex dihydrolipoamide dehydrogenase (E3) component